MIYIAGKLFKDADINERIQEEHALREAGHTDIFNPITQPFNEDKSKALPTSKDIFDGDTQAVIKSDKIVAELDDFDEGVMMELGIAYGINYMLDLLKKATNGSYEKINPNSLTAVDDILNNIPVKKVYAHLTDIRMQSAGEYNGIDVPFGTNQYVMGGVSQMGKIYTNKEAMIKDIV